MCSLGRQRASALSSLCLLWRVAHGGRCMNMQQVSSAHPCDHKHQLYVHAQMFADKHKIEDFAVILWFFPKISSSFLLSVFTIAAGPKRQLLREETAT